MESLQQCNDHELPDFDDTHHHRPLPPPQQSVEDVKIGSASGPLHPDCRFFQFKANDLDAAIWCAKKNQINNREKSKKKRGKSKKKTLRRKLQEMNPKDYVLRTSHYLKEPKRYLLEAAIERLGIYIVNDLVMEVKAIEQNGGQMILDGQRRRTPGGVLWNIIKSRFKKDFKAIMAAGKIYEKERKMKQKLRQLKRNGEGNDDMVIDTLPSKKRRKKGASQQNMAAPQAVQERRNGVNVWPFRSTEIEDIQSKLDPENSCTLTQAHSAWAEGLKHAFHSEDLEMLDGAMNHRLPVGERLRIPIQYDDFIET